MKTDILLMSNSELDELAVEMHEKDLSYMSTQERIDLHKSVSEDCISLFQDGRDKKYAVNIASALYRISHSILEDFMFSSWSNNSQE